MSLINKEISDFTVEAFHNDDFKTVTKQDVLGKWSIFFFYPADFTFVCPTELEDLANKYEEFQKIGCEIYSVSTDRHFHRRPRGPYPVLPGQRGRRRPQCRRTASSCPGVPVRRRARRPGLPREVAAGRRDPQAEPRFGRPAVSRDRGLNVVEPMRDDETKTTKGGCICGLLFCEGA